MYTSKFSQRFIRQRNLAKGQVGSPETSCTDTLIQYLFEKGNAGGGR